MTVKSHAGNTGKQKLFKEGKAMKEIRTNNTKTYDAGDDFRVDIVILPDEYEAWIYRKNSGYKSLMFGIAKEKDGETSITYDRFVKIVTENLDEYIDSYIDDMDGIERYHENLF
jgi:cation diffusion facilitator CzcD-associated flavoprotein CzcO